MEESMANGDDALLTRASIMFHTNDDDKDADSRVEVAVELMDKTLVASIADEFQHFDDNSDAGPFTLLLSGAVTRGALKTGNVSISIAPKGDDRWRFNFFLDLLFSDGAHLLAGATGLELSQSLNSQSFGIE
jgi:hypothetical protein